MDLTKEQAILEHKKMWNWIADEIEKSEYVKNINYLKAEYLEKNKFESIICNCFCCEYTNFDCYLCPLEWNSKLKEFMCEYKDYYNDFESIYARCRRSKNWKEQAQLAREIANLKERENI